jgi:hypothetical protein
MKYRLLKDIGPLGVGYKISDFDGYIKLNVESLVGRGYIEEIQEPWATDKDCYDLLDYWWLNAGKFPNIVEQYKKERGK